MDKRQYHHAIIGCGRIAPIHKAAFVNAGVRRLSFCDLDLGKAVRLSGGDGPVYSDYKCIPTESIHSVSICTDHASHLSIADYFLSRGVSVVVEKPCCLPAQNPEKILADYYFGMPVFTQIVQHRYDSIVLFVKDLIKKGKLGNIVMADFSLFCNRPMEYFTQSPWKGKYATEGGSSLINQAFHLVDLVNFLFGAPQRVVSYKETYWLKDIIETDETSFALFHYPSFSVSLKTTICSSETWMTRLDIIGSRGMVSFSIDEPFTFYLNSSNLDDDVAEFMRQHRNECLDVSPNGYFGNSHLKQIKAFLNATMDGKYEELPTIQSIIDTHKIIQSLYL